MVSPTTKARGQSKQIIPFFIKNGDEFLRRGYLDGCAGNEEGQEMKILR